MIGVITGPNTSNCPSNVTHAERFIRAWGTLAYHEIALLIALGSIFYLCWSAENMFGLWTFVILYFARICAKLNLFFGVPRINVEFVPATLSHLTSHFKISALNWFFPLSVTILTFALGCWIERLLSVNLLSDITGFTLLSSLTAMALLEHWVMVLPIPDAKLWRWMLPQEKQKKTTFVERITMDYDAIFATQLNQLKEEGNYRIFAELERQSGAFPKAKVMMIMRQTKLRCGVLTIILEWDKTQLYKMQ